MAADAEGMERFREVQRLSSNRASWLALPMLAAAAGYSLYLLAVHGFEPAPVFALVVLSLCGFVFLRGELRTVVHSDALEVQYFPMTRLKRYGWDEIESARARSYRPIREYGGWGLRWGPSGGAWNVSGDRGVQLVFRGGRRLLIGSQRAEALALAIEAARSELRRY